jgi:exodeoxyribonuclease V beta subunit
MNILDSKSVELLGKNLIEASAGTGKTFTLAFLVLRMVVEKVKLEDGKLEDRDIGEIVVVTFTKAATAELKERITLFLQIAHTYLTSTIILENSEKTEARNSAGNSTITDYIDAFEDREKKSVLNHLDQAILSLDEAQIYTIHGFCQRLLTDFAFETGAQFGREMLTDVSTLYDEIIRDFWRKEILTLSSSNYLAIISKDGYKNPSDLFAAIKDSVAFPDVKIIGDTVEPVDIEKLEIEIEEAIVSLKSDWQKNRDEVVELFNSLQDGLNKSSYKSLFADNFVSLDLLLDDGISNKTLSEMVKKFSLISANGVKVNKGKEIPTHSFLDICETQLDLLKNKIEERANSTKLLLQWCRVSALGFFVKQLFKRKNERNISDFGDIIEIVANGVTDPNDKKREALIRAVQKRYKVALVDEFQDTDVSQFKIFDELFGEETLFLIGDPKQAIFRFRGGDVYAYLKAVQDVKDDSCGKIFSLNRNFRSEKNLIIGLNTIFSSAETPTFLTPNIGYESVKSGSKLLPLSSDTVENYPIEIWDINSEISYKGTKTTVSKKNIIKEINVVVAEEISRLISGTTFIGEESSRRPVTAGDVAILVSSSKEAMDLKESLALIGINGVTSKMGDIFNSDEAKSITHILEVLLNPSDEAILRSLLLSPLFNFSFEKCNSEIIKVMERFVNYSQIWEQSGVTQMLNQLFVNEDIYSNLKEDGFVGFRPLTNIRHLLEILHKLEIEIGNSPERLLNSFIQRQGELHDEEAQQRLESDEDAVSIVTIHSSKGLEYPILFVPYPWELCYSVASWVSFKKVKTPLYHQSSETILDLSVDAESIENERELDEEFQRLFYVALTRPTQKLYLTHAKISKDGENSPSERFLSTITNSPQILRRPLTDVASIPAIEVKLVSDDSETLDSIRSFKGKILQSEKIKSYSSLVLPHEIVKRESVVEPAGIFAFLKGARTGNAWHRIFELTNYGGSENECREGVEKAMREYGFATDDDGFEETLKMAGRVLLKEFLLHNGLPFSLKDCDKRDRITEMEFNLRACRVSPQKISSIVSKYEPHLDIAIKPESFGGYLTGFIDLLFRSENQYFIVDWKSNHLGNQISDYSKEFVEDAMEQNEYRLQYILYTVALVKFLQNSLGDSFSYEKNIGGSYYIFLRGINLDGNEGIYYHLPKKEMIMELLVEFID